MAELIRLGAYRAGSDAELDRAIAVQPALERLLEQDPHERSAGEAFAALAEALASAAPD
jgi:flagellum-specific ATP synthase